MATKSHQLLGILQQPRVPMSEYLPRLPQILYNCLNSLKLKNDSVKAGLNDVIRIMPDQV